MDGSSMDALIRREIIDSTLSLSGPRGEGNHDDGGEEVEEEASTCPPYPPPPPVLVVVLLVMEVDFG